MLGNELFTVKRPPKPDPLFGVSWAFPNSYLVGMSSLAYQVVWWLLESDVDVAVRRVFTDCHDDRCDGSELVGFTLSWELDYVNVLKALEKLRIAPLSSDRVSGSPIVFGGGPVLSANPEPFAEMFDCVLLGEAESIVPAFINAWKKIRSLPERKAQLLELSRIEGIYVPSLYRYRLASPGGPIESVEPVVEGVPSQLRKQVFDFPSDYAAHSVMLTPDTAWGDMFLVEVVRSCPQACRFCLASYLTRPFRTPSVETLMKKIDLGLRFTSKIGLLGPSVTEHPHFDQIAEELMKRPGTEISIASVRADSLNPLVLKMLHDLGQRSVTIAIESGSERLRSVMKKNLTEAQIERAVELIDQSGLSALKLYGIAGVPGETQADLDETIRLLTTLKNRHKRLHFSFGLSSFVPKAQTPLQWFGRDRRSAEKMEYLRKHLTRAGIAVRPESHNWSDIQALLSRGDRRLTPVLLAVAGGDGGLGGWRSALRHLPPECPGMSYYAFEEIPRDQCLPWSHLVDEPRAGALLKQSRDAFEPTRLHEF